MSSLSKQIVLGMILVMLLLLFAFCVPEGEAQPRPTPTPDGIRVMIHLPLVLDNAPTPWPELYPPGRCLSCHE